MIKLRRISFDDAIDLLKKNGTREEVVKRAILMARGKPIYWGDDNGLKFILVRVGNKSRERFGISKRCTYRKRGVDPYNLSIGFSIAFLRALDLKE